MKIAQIGPIAERVPPKKYGGTERVVWALTEELVARGHEVTLFASGDSQTSATLASVYPRALREARLNDIRATNIVSLLNIGFAYGRQSEFDIIHDHNNEVALPTANIAKTPVLITMHSPFTSENRRLFELLDNPSVVTISNGQLIPKMRINHIGTVYNGLPMEHYPFSNGHKGYLLCVGSFFPQKGIHHAIEVAQYLDMELIIAAKLETTAPADMHYFNEYIAPKLSDTIRWVGEVAEAERNELYANARCFLHPATLRESFGLTLIEAMACGCPVVAFGRGAVPEIVADGKTGFVVNNVEEMIDAVLETDTINRADCRAWALENFNDKKMADGYEEIYRRVIETRSTRSTQ